MSEDLTDRVRIRDERVLSHKRHKFSEYAFDYRRRDGTWQSLKREVYSRGDAAAVLPFDPERGTVILIRQFRLPCFLAGYRQPLVEAIAGVLDGDAPDACARREAMEEAGCEVDALERVSAAFMSPGSVTERIHLFTGRYRRTAKGGGLANEGEDIEVLELPLAEALAMVKSGAICDAKTIMLLYFCALAA
jgi:nudix-type nucleoside diphosphatase (YffH/AdpP family)